jgi:hypothetical protein
MRSYVHTILTISWFSKELRPSSAECGAQTPRHALVLSFGDTLLTETQLTAFAAGRNLPSAVPNPGQLSVERHERVAGASTH